MVVGAGSESYRTLRYLVQRLPAMIGPAWLKTPTQAIAIDDVIAYLVAAPDVPASAGREVQIAGPDVLSYGEMLDLMADALGVRRRPRVPVPLITPWLSSLWIGLVTPVDAGVARPLVEGLSTPTTSSATARRRSSLSYTRCRSWTRSARHSTRITRRQPGGVSAWDARRGRDELRERATDAGARRGSAAAVVGIDTRLECLARSRCRSSRLTLAFDFAVGRSWAARTGVELSAGSGVAGSAAASWSPCGRAPTEL
jgi:hypothetical protein